MPIGTLARTFKDDDDVQVRLYVSVRPDFPYLFEGTGEMEGLVWAVAFTAEYLPYARGTAVAESREEMLRSCVESANDARAAYKEAVPGEEAAAR